MRFARRFGVFLALSGLGRHGASTVKAPSCRRVGPRVPQCEGKRVPHQAQWPENHGAAPREISPSTIFAWRHADRPSMAIVDNRSSRVQFMAWHEGRAR